MLSAGGSAPGYDWVFPVGQNWKQPCRSPALCLVPRPPLPTCPEQPPGRHPAWGGCRVARGQGPPTAVASPPSPSKQPIRALQHPPPIMALLQDPQEERDTFPIHHRYPAVHGFPSCHAPQWTAPIPSRDWSMGSRDLNAQHPTSLSPHSSDTQPTFPPLPQSPSNLVGEGADNQANLCFPCRSGVWDRAHNHVPSQQGRGRGAPVEPSRLPAVTIAGTRLLELKTAPPVTSAHSARHRSLYPLLTPPDLHGGGGQWN